MLPNVSPPPPQPSAYCDSPALSQASAIHERAVRANAWSDQTLPAGVLTLIEPVNRLVQSPKPNGGQSKHGNRSKRALEFARGRALAAKLLNHFGQTEAVGVASDRSPIWPLGTVGSISHSDQLVWVAIGRNSETLSIGVDTEKIVDARTRRMLRNEIASSTEWQIAAQLGLCQLAEFTLVFSAKEAFYKCCYPLNKVFFDFKDVALESITPNKVRLRVSDTHPARTTPNTPSAMPTALDVYFHIDTDHVFTATWISACDHPASKELP